MEQKLCQALVQIQIIFSPHNHCVVSRVSPVWRAGAGSLSCLLVVAGLNKFTHILDS